MNILVFGDSHTDVFEYSNNKQKHFNFEICEVPGATAQGMVNPNSKTNALPIFAKKMSDIDKKNYDKIMIMLGEVDCGFVIWVRSKKYGITIEEQIDCCVNNLFNFIKEHVITKGYKAEDVIICGSVLPTIRDNANKRFLNGARSKVTASQKERTDVTLDYNNKLKQECETNGYYYIDITDTILNTETGIVNGRYLNKNPYNHHLNNLTTYKLWIDKMKKTIL